MNKYDVMRKLIVNLQRMRVGTYFTLSEAYGKGWDDLKVSVRQQSSKEFKIGVARTEIRGVIFHSKDSRGTWVYKRIPATPPE